MRCYRQLVDTRHTGSTPAPGGAIVVLVRPEIAVNVGLVCRAAKTMGINRLRIVRRSAGTATSSPEARGGAAGRSGGAELGLRAAPGSTPADDIRRAAVHAFDVYQRAEWFTDLEDALADVSLSGGFSRRRGKGRKTGSILVDQFAELAAAGGGTVAAVFGNEENGLTSEELACCSTAVHIPSDAEFPSLNLSHAVQVATAALFRTRGRHHGRIAAPRAVTRAAAQDLSGSLAAVGLVRGGEMEGTTEFVRDLLERARVSPTEARRISAIAARAQGRKAKGQDGSTLAGGGHA